MSTNNKDTSQSYKKWIITAAILVGCAAAVLVAVKLPKPEKETPKLDDPVTNVSVMELVPIESYVETMTHKAMAVAWTAMELSAETAGRITAIELDRGDMVLPGATIIRLDDELQRADYERAKIDAEFAAREAERVENAAGAASSSEIDDARSNASGKAAELAAATERLNRTEIKAPAAVHDPSGMSKYIGRLDNLYVEIGEYVQPGKDLAYIIDTSAIKIIVDIPQSDINYVKVGMDADVVIESLDDRRVTGKVHYIHDDSDTLTYTYRVEIKVANPNGDIRSGMFARVTMDRRTLNDIIMIPLDAAIPLERDYEVYIVEDNIARQRFVHLTSELIRANADGVSETLIHPPTGERAGLGLKPGDKLIIRGQRMVSDGQKVAIISDDQVQE